MFLKEKGIPLTAIHKSAEIEAAPERILQIMLNVAEHPRWQKEVSNIDVLESDDQGRPLKTEVTVSAMGQSAKYSLEYEYPSQDAFSYSLIDGDMMTLNNFSFSAKPNGTGSTVDVTQEMDIKWPLPVFMIDQMAAKGVKDMLAALTAQAES